MYDRVSNVKLIAVASMKLTLCSFSTSSWFGIDICSLLFCCFNTVLILVTPMTAKKPVNKMYKGDQDQSVGKYLLYIYSGHL